MSFLRAVLLSLLFTCPVSAETIRVGAAISLKDAVTEIAKKYESAGGDHVEFVFGSSGQIETQIKSGADIDVFVSAANRQVDELAKDNLIDKTSRRIVVTNALVLIVPSDAKDPPTSFDSLSKPTVAKVAVGEPKTVPAGQYAQQVFDSLKLSDSLSGKIVYGANVRQVLTYVERGEVSAGVVYATDAQEAGDKVRVVAKADEKSHEPIVYPGVVVSASKKSTPAARFLDALSKTDAVSVFKAKGFTVEDPRPVLPEKK